MLARTKRPLPPRTPLLVGDRGQLFIEHPPLTPGGASLRLAFGANPGEVMTAVRDALRPEADRDSKPMLSSKAVARRLDLNGRTLKRLMESTPESIERPWTNIGSEKKPTYRWRADAIDRWWKELSAWQASKPEQGSSKSVGAILTAPRGSACAPTRRQRSPSSAKSSSAARSGGGGKLLTLARALTSK